VRFSLSPPSSNKKRQIYFASIVVAGWLLIFIVFIFKMLLCFFLLPCSINSIHRRRRRAKLFPSSSTRRFSVFVQHTSTSLSTSFSDPHPKKKEAQNDERKVLKAQNMRQGFHVLASLSVLSLHYRSGLLPGLSAATFPAGFIAFSLHIPLMLCYFGNNLFILFILSLLS
jgi:hypothetical protein